LEESGRNLPIFGKRHPEAFMLEKEAKARIKIKIAGREEMHEQQSRFFQSEAGVVEYQR
jgi:hypothetical protein